MRCFRKPCLYLDCDLYDLLQLVEDNGSRSKWSALQELNLRPIP